MNVRNSAKRKHGKSKSGSKKVTSRHGNNNKKKQKRKQNGRRRRRVGRRRRSERQRDGSTDWQDLSAAECLASRKTTATGRSLGGRPLERKFSSRRWPTPLTRRRGSLAPTRVASSLFLGLLLLLIIIITIIIITITFSIKNRLTRSQVMGYPGGEWQSLGNIFVFFLVLP